MEQFSAVAVGAVCVSSPFFCGSEKNTDSLPTADVGIIAFIASPKVHNVCFCINSQRANISSVTLISSEQRDSIGFVSNFESVFLSERPKTTAILYRFFEPKGTVT